MTILFTTMTSVQNLMKGIYNLLHMVDVRVSGMWFQIQMRQLLRLV